MARAQSTLLNHIVLNENAYFLRKENEAFFSKAYIDELFESAVLEKAGKPLLNIKRRRQEIAGENIQFSFLVFRFKTIPSFIDELIPKWEEQKLAYFLLVDFKDYVFISKKNISGVDAILYRGLIPVDYSILTGLFVDVETNFEKFSLNNTSVSGDSIKGKTVEADDLKRSFTAFGAGSYVLNSVRLNNHDEKTSISFNTSRISNFGEKKYFNQLFGWAQYVIDRIRHHVQVNSFLNIFAEPIEYEKHRSGLRPISLLFNLSRFNDEIESNLITGCELVLEDGRRRPISLLKVLSLLKRVFNVTSEEREGKEIFLLENNIATDVTLSLNKKSITLSTKKARKINVIYSDDTEMPLIQYFNYYNEFMINFEDLSLVYTNRKLFKDSKLMGYIDNFIDVFKESNSLNGVTSEKGEFENESTSFTNQSVFHFIENEIAANADYLFLDDLGNEWADFIKLGDNSITLIHAKYDTTQLSASSFHEIVSQALKNIGNISPSNDQLEGPKSLKWAETYNIEGSETNITRLRHGDNIGNGIVKYEKLLVTPNLRKEIFIVINFISKALLLDRLHLLQADNPFQERNQVIQILWLVSSLLNSCSENGIIIHIYCRP